MTLHVHRSERADGLVVGLADLLADPVDDVFAEEIIAVPAHGVERWLLQRLSHRLGRAAGEDGVCAGVRFPSPGALVREILGVPEHDEWSPDRLVWPLLELIDEVADQDWCVTLGSHLGVPAQGSDQTDRQGRRYAVARRLAGLFHAYAGYRPGMLRSWTVGDHTDGLDEPLPPDLAWQARLWQLLRDRIDGLDPVQRLDQAADLAAANSTLPQRLSLFGMTRLPAAELAVWAATAQTRDVHLWLPHPSPELWVRIGGEQADGSIRRRLDPTITVPDHPLLASLGREARELRLVLGAGFTDHHHPIPAGPDTLLGRLHTDIRRDAVPRPFRRSPDDRSIQVHACHGASRQVEVLREVLVGLLADDPTLEPRDIVVMCPDIETYAPLIAASFGLADATMAGHPAHQLRVRLADRSVRQTNPLIATADRLLAMAGTRVSASQVLDLAGGPAVRRRFAFDDDQLATLARWIAESGVRWGFDAEHRRAFGLAALPHNTWRTGLDRILFGVAMAEPGWLGTALPLDEVASTDVELAGRLAELIDRLQAGLDALDGEKTVAQWLQALSDGVASLTAVGESEHWQLLELHRQFRAVLVDAGDRADTLLLRLSDVRALLTGRLSGRPTRANFRTGTLTVCTMVPMRSVPHRVVCLLGLDDGVFPRRAWVDGDDVLGRDPVVGERDPRTEDRQLLLDALLAATETVVITYTGADQRSGSVRPPAVPLGELIDVLTLMTESAGPAVGPAAGPAVGPAVVVRHPLQPFDSRVVTPGALGRPGPFSFDPAALAGASAAAGARTRTHGFLDQPLPAVDSAVIDLSALIDVLRYPARAFLRDRLGIAVTAEPGRAADPLVDTITVELKRLERWRVGQRLLECRLAGLDESSCRLAERRRGTLPPGPLGSRVLDELLAEISQLVERTAEFRAAVDRSIEVVLELPDGRELRGRVAGVRGSRLLRVGYAKLSAPERLRSWIELVALSVAEPGASWSATTVGRGEDQPISSALRPIPAGSASAVLAALVDLHDRARRSPLPAPANAAAAYARSRGDGAEVPAAQTSALRAWAERYEQDEAHQRIWGADDTFQTMLSEPPAPDERWTGEPHRFGELARRLWAPLLSHERMGSG